MKKILIKMVDFYKFYISPTFFGSCRYYPTCSQYCKLCLQHGTIFEAFFLTLFRILKCNQFFKGGIDHPIIKKKLNFSRLFFQNKKIKPIVWLVPHKKNSFYVIRLV